jgi:hypothetical protein
VPAPKCTACAVKRDRPELWAVVEVGRARSPRQVPYRTLAEYLTSRDAPIRPHVLRDHFLFHKENR